MNKAKFNKGDKVKSKKPAKKTAKLYFAKKTKRATFIKTEKKIFKTTNSWEDVENREFTEVKDSFDLKNGFENIGKHDNINNALYSFIGILKKDKEVKKTKNAEFKKAGDENYNRISKLKVIPSTLMNIEILLTELNKSILGSFKLPKMSIGYSINQYDADGTNISTIKLDKAINGIKLYKVGSKRGHLEKYTLLRGNITDNTTSKSKKTTKKTDWQIFISKHMGNYMKSEGDHAGAMKRLSKEWKKNNGCKEVKPTTKRKKPTAKKTTAKCKKPTAKKTTAKKPTAKKPTAKGKKPTAKKTTAKKPTAKKTTAKKPTAKGKKPTVKRKRVSLKDLRKSKNPNRQVLYIAYMIRKAYSNHAIIGKSKKEAEKLKKSHSNSMSGIRLGIDNEKDIKVLKSIASKVRPIAQDVNLGKYSAKVKEVWKYLTELYPQPTRKGKKKEKEALPKDFLKF